MKIPFLSILNNVTGISTPIFGISWNPGVLSQEIAQKVLNLLEDRRVLFNPIKLEVPNYVDLSIVQIREKLNELLLVTGLEEDVTERLKLMRKSCRLYLNASEKSMTTQNKADWLKRIRRFKEFRILLCAQVIEMSIAYGIDLDEDFLNQVDLKNYK